MLAQSRETKVASDDHVTYGSELLLLSYTIPYRIALDGTGLKKIGADAFTGLNDLKYFNKADDNGMV